MYKSKWYLCTQLLLAEFTDKKLTLMCPLASGQSCLSPDRCFNTSLEIPLSRVLESFCWVIFISFCRLTFMFLKDPPLSLIDGVHYFASIISKLQHNFLLSLLLSWILSWYWQSRHKKKKKKGIFTFSDC